MGGENWHATEERAQALQGAAARAFPFLASIPPATFGKLPAGTEIAPAPPCCCRWCQTGWPVPALTAFSGSLLAMYLRTPAMHKPGERLAAPAGVAVSKDVWMLGIGLGLIADTARPATGG